MEIKRAMNIMQQKYQIIYFLRVIKYKNIKNVYAARGDEKPRATDNDDDNVERAR